MSDDSLKNIERLENIPLPEVSAQLVKSLRLIIDAATSHNG